MTHEKDLLNRFEHGGPVRMEAPAGGGTIDSAKLGQYIRDFSKRSGNSRDCDSVHLKGFVLRGDLDLESGGLEGAPLMGIELIDCQIRGVLKLSYAVMKSFLFRSSDSCRAVHVDSVEGRGVTVIDRFELERVEMRPEGQLDLRESRLRSGLRVHGLTGEGGMPGIAGISLATSVVGSSLMLKGVRVVSDGRAFDGEELRVEGTVCFGCLTGQAVTHSEFTGELNLRGAQIRGQLLFRGLHLTARVPPQIPTSANVPVFKPVFAMMAEGLTVGGDLLFQHHRQGAVACELTGQVDLAGARIGGELHIHGTFKATERRIRAFRAQRVHVGGDLRFGWLPGHTHGTHGCAVTGECDFSEATVLGKVLFSGSRHEISKDYVRPAGVQRKRKQAVDLKGAKISGDIRLESSAERHCFLEGIALTGATIGGRLLLNGVTVSGADADGGKQKAIIANGVTLSGGIFVNVANPADDPAKNPTVLEGDVRLRNCAVDGPVVFSGVNMTSGASGIALWASNSRFGSDVILNPVGGSKALIEGELRLRGARIRGHLWVQGVKITAGTTGAALDCFTAEIEKTFALGSYCGERIHRGGDPVNCEVQGLVSLAHLKAQSVTIGASPLAKIKDGNDMLSMAGTILLREAKLQGGAIFANVELRPAEDLAEGRAKDEILKQLKRWGVYRPRCVIYANYATLGSRLFVRLKDTSCGLVSLYGATTGTIGAYSGSAEVNGDMDSRMPNRWERLLMATGIRESTTPEENRLRENWGGEIGPITALRRGRPRSHEDAQKTIQLNIDEFTYTRTNDLWEKTPRFDFDPLSLAFWLAGRPTPAQLGPRYEFLQRSTENPGAPERVIVSAHRQLAKVYRDMGYLDLAYALTRERRWLQWRFGKPNPVQRVIDLIYSALFGFGYSPVRAVLTVAVLFLFSLHFVHKAVSTPPRSGGPVPTSSGTLAVTCRNSFCDPTPKSNDQAKVQVGGGAEDKHYMDHCHLPDDTHSWNNWTEAAKLIIPFTRFESNAACSLHVDAPGLLRLELALIHVLSWILFPFAAATLTGVLREAADK